MVMRVQQVGDEFCIVLPREAMEALHLSEGAEVEVKAVHPEIEYASVEEVMEAFIATEPEHREAYLALAK